MVINEIMYHPDTVDDAEYVELLNISSSSVTLYDELVGEPWRFVDDPDNPGLDFRFPVDSPVVIKAGEYLVLVKDLTLFSSKFTVPQGVKVFEWGSGRLDNGARRYRLVSLGTWTCREYGIGYGWIGLRIVMVRILMSSLIRLIPGLKMRTA